MASALSLIGLGMDITGGLSEADEQAATLEYNATVAQLDAEQVEKQKGQELHKLKTAQRKLLARQIAVTAASGRDFSGSPLDVIARSESAFLLDAHILESNAALAKGRLYSEAIFSADRASATLSAGRTRAVGTGFSSVGKLVGKNYFGRKPASAKSANPYGTLRADPYHSYGSA